MDRLSNLATVRHRRRQWQPAPGGGPLEQCHVRRRVRQMPHTSQLACRQDRLAACHAKPDGQMQIAEVPIPEMPEELKQIIKEMG